MFSRVAVVILLWSSLANASPEPQGILLSGASIGSHSNVIGGREAVPHSFPSVVWIDGWGVCEGHLISDQWVVTIAQCIERAESATLLFGAHNRNEAEPEQVTMVSTEFIVHEFFHAYDFLNDIALIKLPEPIEFTSAIEPAELPSYDIKDGESAVLNGWGQTTESDPNYSDVLMEGDVTISPNNDCDEYYGQRHDKTVCVMTDTGSAPFCQGDFGAGLYKDGTFHGIASFYSGAGCESGGGDVYTRIYDFVDWIKENTGI